MRRAVISRRTVSRWQKWRRVVRFIGSLVTFPSPPDAAKKYIYRSSKTRCMHTVGESEIGRSRFSWGTSRAKVFHAAFPQRGVTRFENLTVERRWCRRERRWNERRRRGRKERRERWKWNGCRWRWRDELDSRRWKIHLDDNSSVAFFIEPRNFLIHCLYPV